MKHQHVLDKNTQSLTDACVGAHHQHGKVRAIAGEAEDGGLQVLVVSCEVDEGDHLGGALADLLRCPRLAVIHNLSQVKYKQAPLKDRTVIGRS